MAGTAGATVSESTSQGLRGHGGPDPGPLAGPGRDLPVNHWVDCLSQPESPHCDGRARVVTGPSAGRGHRQCQCPGPVTAAAATARARRRPRAARRPLPHWPLPKLHWQNSSLTWSVAESRAGESDRVRAGPCRGPATGVTVTVTEQTTRRWAGPDWHVAAANGADSAGIMMPSPRRWPLSQRPGQSISHGINRDSGTAGPAPSLDGPGGGVRK